jgi:hypothetical protein
MNRVTGRAISNHKRDTPIYSVNYLHKRIGCEVEIMLERERPDTCYTNTIYIIKIKSFGWLKLQKLIQKLTKGGGE